MRNVPSMVACREGRITILRVRRAAVPAERAAGPASARPRNGSAGSGPAAPPRSIWREPLPVLADRRKHVNHDSAARARNGLVRHATRDGVRVAWPKLAFFSTDGETQRAAQ